MSMKNLTEKIPAKQFASVRNFPVCKWSETPDNKFDYTFSNERVRRPESFSYSPLQLQLKPTIQNSSEDVFEEIIKFSIRSGLKRINAYEAVSKLKLLAYRGMSKLKLDEFCTFIFQMHQFRYIPSHILKTMKQYLSNIYKIFDSKSIVNIFIDFGEVSYKKIGQFLIIFCSGSKQDKVEAIGLLYEKYGIKNIESSEMASMFKGVFKIYKNFDPNMFEGQTLTEVSSSIIDKCWNDLMTSTNNPIETFQLYNWIKEENCERSITQSKVKIKLNIKKLIDQTLEHFLNNEELPDFINVKLIINLGT